ncbi:hypothetical protein ACO1ZW_23365, partial [Enterobacter kobei]
QPSFVRWLFFAAIPTQSWERSVTIKPVYTPLALRDWFRAAPRHPLKALTRLRLAQPRAVQEILSQSTRRFCLPVMLTFGSFSRVYLFSSNEAFTADVNRGVLLSLVFHQETL